MYKYLLALILLLAIGCSVAPDNCLDWCLWRLDWQRADIVRSADPVYPCIASFIVGTDQSTGKIIQHAVVVWGASDRYFRVSDNGSITREAVELIPRNKYRIAVWWVKE